VGQKQQSISTTHGYTITHGYKSKLLLQSTLTHHSRRVISYSSFQGWELPSIGVGCKLVACRWYSSCVWTGLICDCTSLSSKESTMLCYEEWTALWMEIRVAYYSGLCVVLRSSCFACADCCTHIV
jgi:hypothetical protein